MDAAGAAASGGSMMIPPLCAGLATGLGGILAAFLGGRPKPSHMAFVLAFAAGVHLHVAA